MALFGVRVVQDDGTDASGHRAVVCTLAFRSGGWAVGVWRAGSAAVLPPGCGFSPRGIRRAGDAGSPAGV